MTDLFRKMNGKLNKKANSSGGFTLAETLMTILLMTIVLSAVTGGMVVARNAYRELSRKADAQTLLATTISVLTEDLSNASDFKPDEEDKEKGYAGYSFKTSSRGYRITYRNAGSGATGTAETTGGLTTGTTAASGKKGIYVVPVNGTTKETGTEVPLVTQKTSTLDLYTEIEMEPKTVNDFSVMEVTVRVYSSLLSGTGENRKAVETGKVFISTAADT